MTTAKYLSHFTNEFQFGDIECSARTTQVNLVEIKDSAKKLLGQGFAVAWAYKFALNGLRLKPSDFVAYKGSKMTAEEFTAKLRTKDNHCTDAQLASMGSGGFGINCDKRSVTATRLVRAYAADLSNLISKGLAVPEELASLAKEAGLDRKYAFLDAAYGMDDRTLEEIAPAFLDFCRNFDRQIAEAYDAGHIKTSGAGERHSHAKSFMAYADWRGFKFGTE
jgi:hypothetical protein